MKMILAEFTGKRLGFYRLKPLMKVGRPDCPLCGGIGHVGRTTCDIKMLPRKLKLNEKT